MRTTRTYKYRIYPTKAQRTNLLNQFSMCRHLYNWSLAERRDAYEKDKTYITYNEQQNKLPQMKKERTWYKGVYSLVLQDVLQRLDTTYKNYYRYIKKNGCRTKENGKIEGYPQFKKKGQWTSIYYPQYQYRPNDIIKVPKVGNVKVVYHREVPEEAKIKTMTISREGYKWFACFTAEIEVSAPVFKQGLSPLGIDLGVTDFVYASNGYSVSPPKWYREKKKHLVKLQRKFSNEEKYTAKWYKLLYAIQKTHYKIRCQRDDFLHKEANKILALTDTVIFEKLNTKKMVARPKKIKAEDGSYLPNGAKYKAMLNQSINNMGWYKFIQIMQYKADEQGKKLIGVPPQYTSQICSACGEIVKKSLSVRTHKCSCGFIANRDYNASLNILALGLESLAVA